LVEVKMPLRSPTDVCRDGGCSLVGFLASISVGFAPSELESEVASWWEVFSFKGCPFRSPNMRDRRVAIDGRTSLAGAY
jgi:hypothetical protein